MKKKMPKRMTAGMPQIPPEVRARFPYIRQTYPQYRNFSDEQLWMEVQRQLMQLQAAQQQQVMLQRQQRPPRQNNSYGYSGYEGAGIGSAKMRELFGGNR